MGGCGTVDVWRVSVECVVGFWRATRRLAGRPGHRKALVGPADASFASPRRPRLSSHAHPETIHEVNLPLPLPSKGGQSGATLSWRSSRRPAAPTASPTRARRPRRPSARATPELSTRGSHFI